MATPGDDILAAIFVTHGAPTGGLPPEVLRLAEAFRQIHGDVLISSETGGYHLNMASPFILATEGSIELTKKHLAVNASKYFGLGEYAELKPRSREKCALCMKSRTPYKVENLLDMPPLAQRGYPDAPLGKLLDKVRNRHEIDDGRGNKIPDHPGRVIRLNELPADHPAITYVQTREGGPYDLNVLVNMFGAAYCEEAAPEDRAIGRFYRKLHLGWKDGPQGRIIFYGFIRGVQRIWQGRYLEIDDANSRWVWHGYRREWIRTAYRESREAGWLPMPPFDQPYINGLGDAIPWKPHKYQNAMDCQRGEWGLLGYDAATAWNAGRPRNKRFAILNEGPFDAGRFGPPAIAAVGSYLSAEQARLLAMEFPTVILAQDGDKPGIAARASARAALSVHGIRLLDIEPLPGHDFGSMTRSQCWTPVLPLLSQIN